MTKVIEKLMNIWAKISSLFVTFLLIQGIYLSVKILLLSIELPIKTPWFTFLLPFTSVSVIIFYFPLFYFGWVKKPKNEIMKMWAKVLTIIYPLLAIIGFISPWGLELKDIPSIIPMFLAIVPLYYYGWRD